MIKNESPIERILRLVPNELESAVRECGKAGLEEIRARAGRPVQLLYSDREETLPLIADARFLSLLLEGLSEHSAFALEEELCRGYFSVGACRVGVCGRAVLEEGRLKRFSHISSFNIRIAAEYPGCASHVMHEFVDGAGAPRSVLVLSAPGEGKTTLLRDAARQLSDSGRKVCIADERGELSGACMGAPTLDVGARTDVMDACPKAVAMELMIRSMSPEVVITDEIGSDADAEAVLFASASGVRIVASAHAGSAEEAMRKPYIAKLISAGCFSRVLLLRRLGGEPRAAVVEL